MEDIKDFLRQSNIDVSSSDSDTESEISFGKQEPSEASSVDNEVVSGGKRKKNGSARLPTRRPDPNVYNRNALLARENRRKKKAYLEAVEKELENVRSANKSLLKALKKQFKATKKLEKERQYFKNILANYKDIKNITSLLNGRISSPTNSATMSPDESLRSAYSRSGSYEQCGGGTTNYTSLQNSDNGSVAEQLYANPMERSSSSLSNFLDNFFSDYQSTSPAYNNTWNELLDEDCFGFREPNSPSDTFNMVADKEACVISNEHSYFKDATPTDHKENSGVCLHIADGRISLEFCPSCHWNASCTPPTQLLQDEDSLEKGRSQRPECL